MGHPLKMVLGMSSLYAINNTAGTDKEKASNIVLTVLNKALLFSQLVNN